MFIYLFPFSLSFFTVRKLNLFKANTIGFKTNIPAVVTEWSKTPILQIQLEIVRNMHTQREIYKLELPS